MKKPFVTLEQLLEIKKNFPTPFHLYDEKGIRKTAQAVNRAFNWNTGFKEYFAVKANPNPAILAILKEEGCGADCSSMTELMLAEAVGFRGADIMFSSNDTPAEEFAYAMKLGAIINLDDHSHIDFLEECAGVPETICCRFNPGEFGVNNSIMSEPAESKYGFTKKQLWDGIGRLLEKGAKVFGLHAFLASNTLGDEYYPALAALLAETAVGIKRDTGVAVSFINLSGGVGIPYRPDEKANDINRVGEMVKDVFERILEPAGLGGMKLCTELGRFMLGPNGCLVATVLHKKDTYKQYVGLDACAADLMRPAIYGAYHHITVAGKEDAPPSEVYDVTGALCENNDKFAIDRPLPFVERGDLLVIHDTGAHGHAMGYNYNGRLRSAELLLLEGGGVKLIRRAETPGDYFATLSGTEWHEVLNRL